MDLLSVRPSFKLGGMPQPNSDPLLYLPQTTVETLLHYYDYPHPEKPGQIIEGYDKPHALRTAKMCTAVAKHLGHDRDRLRDYQIACLLHDLGRAGLDLKLFGTIWTWAREQDVPTRPVEWRAVHPETEYGQETEAFWTLYGDQITALGLQDNDWTREQVEMRLGYGRRLRRQVKKTLSALKKHGVNWSTWMEKVVLYYYYPEQMQDQPPWVRELGEILVACEQLEAYSNRERGSDYYNRKQESFSEAFLYLDSLKDKGQLGSRVLSGLRTLTADGVFDSILIDARNGDISDEELRTLHSISREPHACR